jgi:hypothetical protein
MSVYTVYEPPLRAADASAAPERFTFVRDGFAVWAFLLTPFWMLWHRLWLVLVLYLGGMAGLDAALLAAGASAGLVVFVGMIISFLIGLEAGTLRRFTLSRRGWRNIGIVSGDDREDAERRFFDVWVRNAALQSAVPSPSAPSMPSAPLLRLPQAGGVVGLFPEPGGQR